MRMAAVSWALDSFLNELHVTEAVATAVAVDGLRISSRFSMELSFSIPGQGSIFFSLLGNVFFPYYLVNQISKFCPANGTNSCFILGVIWLSQEYF